jgi:hypothetical protein
MLTLVSRVMYVQPPFKKLHYGQYYEAICLQVRAALDTAYEAWTGFRYNPQCIRHIPRTAQMPFVWLPTMPPSPHARPT